MYKENSTEDSQYEDDQLHLTRVFEVFVKDDDMPDGKEGKNEVLPGSSQRHAIQIPEMASTTEESLVIMQQSVPERAAIKGGQVIDKDDPRSRMHYVKYHKRDGKTLKVWECGICSKEFRHQYTLMRHLPTHTDERNFKCDSCGKAFRQLSTLSQHKAIHSDARPYVCEFCKKTFNRVSTLISHRKTHSEHKPHKCHLCGKGFHQKGNLRNHVFTHTNERPYKCEICQKGFNQMSNLVCHKVKAHAHTERMQYSCGICGEDFPRRFALRSHEESKHGIKYRQTSQANNNEASTSKKPNVRIVDLQEAEPNPVPELKDKDDGMTEFMENIIIDKIETKAMETALQQNQIPFALFKPAKGIPVLVKVTPSGSTNHLLTPATPNDLKMSGKMDDSTSLSVQIKVPVVAVITEIVDDTGKVAFEIEPPGQDQEQDSLVSSIDPTIVYPEGPHSDINDAPKQPTRDQLLSLAAEGTIQFVRATEDGRYEVMTSSEAQNLMSLRNHDVTILDGEEAEAILLNQVPNPAPLVSTHPTELAVNDGKMSTHGLSSILTERDIKVLENKAIQDQLYETISIFSHPIMNQFLVPPTKTGDTGLPAIDNDDSGIGISYSASDDISMLVDELPADIDTRHLTDYPNLGEYDNCGEIVTQNNQPTYSFDPYAGINPMADNPYNVLSEYATYSTERLAAKKLESDILAEMNADALQAIDLGLHDDPKATPNQPTYHDMATQPYNMGISAINPLEIQKLKGDADNYMLPNCGPYAAADYLFDTRFTSEDLGSSGG